MSTRTASARTTLVLLDEHSDATVTVIPRDRDSFCISVEEAVSACRMVDAGYSFVRQVADLRDELSTWIDAHRADIQAAYISFRSSGILFVVVQKEVRRNNRLADDLTELDIRIANDDRFDLLNVDVLSLPKASREALSAFLSSGNVEHYAGQERPREGGA